MEITPGSFYSGTSGLKLPMPKNAFPNEFSEKSRLAYYALHNNSLEVNSSFYKIPLPRTILKWAAEVPENFRFTFKLFKGITHNRGLEFNPEDISKFMQAISEVGHKKGCLLIQFPPGLTVAAFDRLRILLDDIRQTDPFEQWKLAIEFRNKTWYTDKTFQLLEADRCSLVIQDIPASATPFIDSDLNVVYLRFHGPKGDYRGGYHQDVLSEYAEYIKQRIHEGKTVYAYFNNTIGDALQDLDRLRSYIGDL